jgi:hypothetical protein
MDVERRSELGEQMLIAASRGSLFRVESLIAQGADVNYIDPRAGVRVFSLWCGYCQYIIMFFLVV